MLRFVVRNSVPFHLLCAWILFENPRSCSHFGFSVSLRLCCCMYFFYFFYQQWGRYSHGARAPEGDWVARMRSRGFPRRWPSLAKTPTTSSPSLVAMATPWWPSDVCCHVHMQLIHYHDTFSYALRPSPSPHLPFHIMKLGEGGIMESCC